MHLRLDFSILKTKPFLQNAKLRKYNLLHRIFQINAVDRFYDISGKEMGDQKCDKYDKQCDSGKCRKYLYKPAPDTQSLT